MKEAEEELNCGYSMSILVAVNSFEIVPNKKLVYDVQNDEKSVRCLMKSPKVSYNTHNILQVFEYFQVFCVFPKYIDAGTGSERKSLRIRSK